MKIKNKGKVHPSPSSSSSSSSASSVIISGSSSPNRDALSVLSLLPAAILALASVLSLQDREVLAYMITRSMKTTTTTTTTTTTSNSSSSSSSSSVVHDSKKKLKKPSQSSSNSNCNNSANHKPPLFDCDCFGCYTCYWFRWDSSPNRELIHQVIEAFEDHLAHGEKSKKINGKGGKRKEKSSRRTADKPADKSDSPPPKLEIEILNTALPETEVIISSEMEPLPEIIDPVEVNRDEAVVDGSDVDVDDDDDVAEEATAASARNAAANNHKGLARKVLPDVLGLFNSRLWNLWGTNV